MFRFREAWAHTKFGLKVSASQILFYIYTNIDFLVVGAVFGREANGYYKAAYDLVLEPMRFIKEPITHVALAAFSRLKRAKVELLEQFLSLTRVNMVVMLLFVLVVFLEADTLIELLFGQTWAPAAMAARILCAVGVLRAMSFVVPPLLDGVGRPGATLGYTLVAAVILPTTYLLAALYIGPRLPPGQQYLSVAIAWAVGYPIAFAVLVYLALKVVGVPGKAYLRVVVGMMGCAASGPGPGRTGSHAHRRCARCREDRRGDRRRVRGLRRAPVEVAGAGHRRGLQAATLASRRARRGSGRPGAARRP